MASLWVFGYHRAMTSSKAAQGVARWVAFLVALVVVGPVIGWIAGRIPPVPGAAQGTFLVSSSSVMGFVGIAACAVLTVVMGMVASRVVSTGLGLTCAGVALAWATFHTGHLPDLARAVDPTSLGRSLTVEGAIVGVFTLVAAIAIARRGWPDEPFAVKSMLSGSALAGAAVATAAGMAAAWVIAQDDKPGQTLAAAFAAGAAGAALARTVVHGAPRSSVLLAIPIGAVLCPLVGFAMTSGSMDTAILGGRVSPWARIMPIDWCAGMLIGIPLGLSWAGSMIEKSHAGAASTTGSTPGPVTAAS